MRGEPYLDSSTTLRPLGPSVTPTTSASLSTPFFMRWMAPSSWKYRSCTTFCLVQRSVCASNPLCGARRAQHVAAAAAMTPSVRRACSGPTVRLLAPRCHASDAFGSLAHIAGFWSRVVTLAADHTKHQPCFDEIQPYIILKEAIGPRGRDHAPLASSSRQRGTAWRLHQGFWHPTDGLAERQ